MLLVPSHLRIRLRNPVCLLGIVVWSATRCYVTPDWLWCLSGFIVVLTMAVTTQEHYHLLLINSINLSGLVLAMLSPHLPSCGTSFTAVVLTGHSTTGASFACGYGFIRFLVWVFVIGNETVVHSLACKWRPRLGCLLATVLHPNYCVGTMESNHAFKRMSFNPPCVSRHARTYINRPGIVFCPRSSVTL